MDKKIASINVFTDADNEYSVYMWNADGYGLGMHEGHLHDNLFNVLCDVGCFYGFRLCDVEVYLNWEAIDAFDLPH